MTNLSIKQINESTQPNSASTNENRYYSYRSTHSGCSPVTDGGDI